MDTKWDSITTALEPFNTEPSLDPSTQYMVPRPETSELDQVIGGIEEQLGHLQVWSMNAVNLFPIYIQPSCQTFLIPIFSHISPMQ